MFIFYIVIFIGFIGLTILSYVKYVYIKNEYYTKNEYLTQLVSSSVDNILNQYEITLEILAEQLLKDDLYNDKKKAQQLLDKLLAKNPSLLGFGLADTNGNFITVSSNIDINKIQNLRENNISYASFQEALHSKKIIVGRTYYVKGLDKWVIPLRKTIFDKDGNPLVVMTTGLNIENAGGVFENLKLKDGMKIVIAKKYKFENKVYRVYYSGNDVKEKTILYDRPIPEVAMKLLAQGIKKKYNLSLRDFNDGERVVTIDANMRDISGVNVYLSLIYNKKYDLWVVVTSPSRNWQIPLIQTIIIYFGIYFLLSYILYFLFRHIHKAEEAKKAELHYQATHDPLTKLPNRVYMQNNILEWIRKFEGKCTVLFVDLDNFKNINDKFGHQIGDKLLQNVAKRFKNYFNEERLIVRQGGDEFIILAPMMQEDEKRELITEMIEDISQPYEIDGLEFNISASVGTADYPNDTTDVEELFALADIAMYEAKKNKNTYASFSNTMREEIFDKIAMENELRNALQKDEFWMVYQPQVSLDGSLHGVEALIRWKNEKLGMVSPELFIKAAEEIGIIHSIGDFIIQKALEEVRDIKKELNVNFSLSINIAVGQIMEKNFLDKVIDFIECAQCKKEEITLEITETTFIEDVEYVLPILNEIRSHGIGLSLDDFGTGYSSLSMLKRLPIDELKIDKSFVDNILTDKKNKTLVKNIIKMGNELSMDTLAEGTEDYKQVELLKAFGCKLFQGYYFSKPLTKEDLIAFIKKQENRE